MKVVLRQLFSLVLPITVLIIVPLWIEPRMAGALSVQRSVVGFQFYLGLGKVLLVSLYMPPPLVGAALPLKVAFFTVGLLEYLYIPPPRFEVELPLKFTFVRCGLLAELFIPPA